MSDAASTELWAVGCYRVGDTTVTLPVSHDDVGRDTASAGRALRSLGVARGDHVLFVSMLSESAQIWPFEVAALLEGVVLSNADATASDAARVAMFARRLPLRAVLGVDEVVLDGLEAVGEHPADVFGAVPVVGARPRAHRRLVDEGLRPHQWVPLGPTVAVECTERAGAHVDAEEWRVDEANGEILLTSRHFRALPLRRAPTGVTGAVVEGPCGCGRDDPRVVPA